MHVHARRGTFISHKFALRAGIAVLPSTGYSAATSANGTPVRIFGMAVVHLNLQSLHCKIRCLVADLGADHDVIIGEPWLREHRAVLSYDHLDVHMHVHKGKKTLLLRCGTIDGAHKGFNPLEPDQSSVNGIPVLTCIQMEALLRQPGHRMFVVRVTDASPNGPCLASVRPILMT
jgi:hypothetical protein